MRVDRLLELADFLENHVSPQKFDMRSWATTGFKEGTCGSTACALGWATVLFKNDGLVLNDSNRPEYGGSIYIDAALDFFDIPRSAASWLFLTAGYPDCSIAFFVARIRGYVVNPDE